MLKRRITPCLDVRNGRTVKGVRFEGLRDAGDPVELGGRYAREGADELFFLDVAATGEGRKAATRLAERVARELFIPFTIGGGLRTVEEMREVLHAGADRAAINTAAVRRPALIAEAAERFGSQAVVVAIDAAQRPAASSALPTSSGLAAGPSLRPSRSRWEVRTRAGSEPTGLDAVEWAVEAVALGAGEILLTSIHRDGTGEGFDVELVRAVCEAVDVPVVASGGAGTPEHFAQAFEAGAGAALAASLFHYGRLRIPDLKSYLTARGFPVRPSPPDAERMSEPRFDGAASAGRAAP